MSQNEDIAPGEEHLGDDDEATEGIASYLIGLGLAVLLTVDGVGAVSFGRTWPILLIVFGVFKLAERSGARTI